MQPLGLWNAKTRKSKPSGGARPGVIEKKKKITNCQTVNQFIKL